jgi:hypothetical protein
LRHPREKPANWHPEAPRAGLFCWDVANRFASYVLPAFMPPLESQLSAAKAHLRSLQDKLRLAQAQVTWAQDAIAAAEKNIAKIERAIALRAAHDEVKPD